MPSSEESHALSTLGLESSFLCLPHSLPVATHPPMRSFWELFLSLESFSGEHQCSGLVPVLGLRVSVWGFTHFLFLTSQLHQLGGDSALPHPPGHLPEAVGPQCVSFPTPLVPWCWEWGVGRERKGLGSGVSRAQEGRKVLGLGGF